VQTKHKYELTLKTARVIRSATRDPRRARSLLGNLARRLERQHFGATASLREKLEETLTVMRLGLPENLEQMLSSTNLIENLFSRVREIGRRVRHWQSGTMVLRWNRSLGVGSRARAPQADWLSRDAGLVAALRAHDTNSSRPGVDETENAAYLTMQPLPNSNSRAGIT